MTNISVPGGGRSPNSSIRLALVAVAVFVGFDCFGRDRFVLGGGSEKKASRVKNDEVQTGTPLVELQRTGSIASQYCEAARDAVSEARYAHQSAELETLAERIEERLVKLNAQVVQIKDWLAKRDAFVQKANQQLIGIFGSMRPEAASEQMVRLDPVTAAAILMRLDARASSTILNDMPPDKAARLTAIIADAARKSAQVVKP